MPPPIRFLTLNCVSITRQLAVCRCYSTSTSRRVVPSSPDEYHHYLSNLTDKELSAFSLALSDVLKESAEPAIKPTTKQLQLVLYEAMLPFIGFGFLDNFVMIIAGEYIDITIGTALGISTMAAAAFGNLISDLFGLGFADTVEALCRRLGIPNPKLKSSQMKLNSVIWMKRLGRVIGVTIGCIIGMAPLYWFDTSSTDNVKDHKS